MIVHLKKIAMLTMLAGIVMLTSCNQDNEVSDEVSVENFTIASIYNLQERARVGKLGCYELVFPVTIEFADGTTAEVDSYDALKEAIRTWKEANPDATTRPSFVYPIDVVSQEGETITIDSQDGLQELRKACRGMFGPRPGGFHRHCFKLVFPVTIEFPDGTTAEVDNRMELKQAIRGWKEANPDATERPHLAFPLTVELRDGSEVTVENKEELKALKEQCRG